MCSCPAHQDLADCVCQCDHTNDRLRQHRQRNRELYAEVDRLRALAPEPTRAPAVVHAPGSTAETGSTGVPEPHARPEPVRWGQGKDCPHRPEWHCEAHGECRGCECGCDTVNPEVDLASAWPDVDGWTLRPHPDGIGLYHSCDSRAFLTGPVFPVGAVLAYIADPPVPDGEPGYIAEVVACPACRAQSTEEETR